MHTPVLLKESLDYLDVEHGHEFIDCTAGGGGHTRAILKTNSKARVLGIDLDQTSLDKLKNQFTQEGLDQRSVLVAGNYKDLDKFAQEHEFTKVHGILMDLGFSSLQLDDPERGLSFQTAGPLDMRYSREAKVSAKDVVNHYTLPRLTEIFKDLGEEKFAHKIAQNILKIRQSQSIESTVQLAEIIKESLPPSIRFKANDHIRRIFQGIRIEVNQELLNLKIALPKALNLLESGGRLVIISFHSLEDRIVKEFFAQESRGCVCPPEFPTCICDKASTLRILTRKPVQATAEEILINSRSKPAKLRAGQKI
ncbi:MAG TPA: 16S rRNA (cytosine(1402)-N(4))-methyltransferase RsmH [Methylomirabilota bacterium]|nr:16S rRNA (cytosine(1402)-N(4))-methyltransferase RsmH [Methylomirabilota bacterium]